MTPSISKSDKPNQTSEDNAVRKPAIWYRNKYLVVIRHPLWFMRTVIVVFHHTLMIVRKRNKS